MWDSFVEPSCWCDDVGIILGESCVLLISSSVAGSIMNVYHEKITFIFHKQINGFFIKNWNSHGLEWLIKLGVPRGISLF